MKTNHFFNSLLAVTALLVASCSTPKMAQNAAIQDDVYNTTAQAKEYKASEPVQATQTDDQSGADYYGRTNPNYDMDYYSRIDRFYYGNQYRGYYDPYYNFYGYNSYYSPYNFGYGYGLGFGGLGLYYGNYFNNWGYFGSPYYNPYWGIYSGYNYFGTGYYGGYGGYYGGGGYYAGRNTYNPNYGPRPDRSNGGARSGSNYNGSMPNRGNVGSSGLDRPSRSSSYNPVTNGSSNASSRPNRTSSGSSESARPTRTESRPTYSPPARESYSPPPSSSSSGRSGGSSSSGGSRPTRGGGRG